MKSRYTTIEFPVFCNYIVHVEVASDIKKAMSKYPQTKDIELISTNAITVHEVDTPLSMIFLPYNVSVDTIAHESWHVVHQIMNHVGVELDSETVAYHLGYLVGKIFEFVRNKK